MPAVDIVDSTWLHTSPAALGVLVGDAANWRRWWPGLGLRPTDLRGAKGVRWDVERIGVGPARGLAGTAEIWLQSSDDGVIAHFFLRLDPPAGTTVGERAARRIEQHYRARTKRAFWAVADQLDPGRMTRLGAIAAGGVPGGATVGTVGTVGTEGGTKGGTKGVANGGATTGMRARAGWHR